MDVVLGISMAPSTVRMLLLEGEDADGAIVDRDDLAINRTNGGANAAPDRVLAAILGTREGAAANGLRLTSTGVAVSDQTNTGTLRDALANHKLENVMLVSAFLAAAALAQAAGTAAGRERTALLFVEPDAATAAVVDSADGSITDVQHLPLADDDVEAVAALTRMVSGMGQSPARPGGVFVVGSGGVDVTVITPELTAATTLPVSAPEDPDVALARGAALASAHAPLFSSSTQALAWAQAPGAGDADAPPTSLVEVDYDATEDEGALAYSAVPDQSGDPELADSRVPDFGTAEIQPGHKPFLLAGSALAALFVVGMAALVMALAISIRPSNTGHTGHAARPDVGGNIVVPAKPAPAPPPKPKPLPPPAQPAPAAPAPAPAEAPAPVEAPAPPAPAPAAPPPVIAPIVPPLPIPGLPGGPPILNPPGRWDGDHGGWGHDHGGWGGDRGGGGWGRDSQPGIQIPLPIPGLHLGF